MSGQFPNSHDDRTFTSYGMMAPNNPPPGNTAPHLPNYPHTNTQFSARRLAPKPTTSTQMAHGSPITELASPSAQSLQHAPLPSATQAPPPVVHVLPPRDVRNALPFLPLPSLTPAVDIVGDITTPRIVPSDLPQWDLSLPIQPVCPPLSLEHSPYLAALLPRINQQLSKIRLKPMAVPVPPTQPPIHLTEPQHPGFAGQVLSNTTMSAIPSAPLCQSAPLPSLRQKLTQYKASILPEAKPNPAVSTSQCHEFSHVLTPPPQAQAHASPTASTRQERTSSPAMVIEISTATSSGVPSIAPVPTDSSATSNITQTVFSHLDDAMNDLFVAEDALAQDTSANLAGATQIAHSKWFYLPDDSSLTPVLRIEAVGKLKRLTGKAAQYQQLHRFSTDTLVRLFKVLEHAIQDGEKVNLRDQLETNGPQLVDNSTLTEEEKLDVADQLERLAQRVANGVQAAVTVLTILTAQRLDDPLYNEDLIALILRLIKRQFNELVLTQVSLKDNESHSLARCLTKAAKLKRILGTIVAGMQVLLDKLSALVDLQEFSDTVVITVCFNTIPIFFVDPTKSLSVLSTNHLATIRIAALALLRSVFARYPGQRTWILEEILTSLIKLPTASRDLRQYKLIDSRSIQVVSALVMQLIQSCAEVPLITKSYTASGEFKVKLDGATTSLDTDECLQHFKTVIDAASHSANYFIMYLLSRCAKQRSSTEAEYKAILENFIDDALTVLNQPEWPAAELILRILCKHFMGYVDDKKADTALKALAIDYLGLTAARIKKWHLIHVVPDVPVADDTCQNEAGKASEAPSSQASLTESEQERLKLVDRVMRQVPPGDISSQTDAIAIHHLWDDEKYVVDYFTQAAAHTPEITGAASFLLSEWGHGLFASLARGTDPNPRDEFDEPMPEILKQLLIRFGHWTRHMLQRVRSAARGASLTLEKSESLEARPLAQVTLEVLASRQPLFQSFDAILARILAALDLNIVAFRTKALRALGQIINHYPSLLGYLNVKLAINQRLQDSSPAVRDAAIELVSRYLAQRPEITQQYYKPISERILDMGLNVRKRVIRLLRDIYHQSQDAELKVDIADRIAHRTHDEDSNVSQLAYRTVQELWFSPLRSADTQTDLVGSALSPPGLTTLSTSGLPQGTASATGLAAGSHAYSELSLTEKGALLARVRTVLGIIHRSDSLTSVAAQGEIVGDILRHVLTKASPTEQEGLMTMYQWYVDCLIKRVLSLEETSERDEILPCIHLLHLFSRARCQLFTEAHLMTLQPYLKESATGGSEQKVLQYVVMIFHETLPGLKHINPSLLAQVEKELLTILSKSPQLILNVAIPCLCQVVERLTSSYQFLTRVLRSCFDKLTREAQGMTAGKPLPPLTTLMRMLILLGLVCRYFNFDAHRTTQPDRFPELHAFPPGTVTTRVFATVAKFTQSSLPQALQLVAVQSLGNLFQGYPSLMLRDESRTLMDRIFASTDRDLKLQLLKVFLELLNQEQLKLDQDKNGTPATNAKLNATVDLKVLIGNAQELGDAGVCSAIMQCYVDAIIDCIRQSHPPLKVVATDVIAGIVTQGLTHPLKCVPILVALQTDPSAALREKATRLYGQLCAKFPSFIYSRALEAVRQAYEYQVMLKQGTQASVCGYVLDHGEHRPRALLDPFYGGLRDKKNRRNEFLHALVKVFDVDLKRRRQQAADIPYCKFLAETLFALEYKLLEEVLFVVYYIQRLLAVAGTNIAHQLNDELATLTQDKQIRLAKVSVCVAMLAATKEQLKKVYGLTESRCQQFNPNDLSALKDKYVSRHANAPMTLSWESLPYVSKEIVTNHDIQVQQLTFAQLIGETPTLDQPDPTPKGLSAADPTALGLPDFNSVPAEPMEEFEAPTTGLVDVSQLLLSTNGQSVMGNTLGDANAPGVVPVDSSLAAPTSASAAATAVTPTPFRQVTSRSNLANVASATNALTDWATSHTSLMSGTIADWDATERTCFQGIKRVASPEHNDVVATDLFSFNHEASLPKRPKF